MSVPLLKLTVLTPENQWLEDEFPFLDDLVSGAKVFVSGSCSHEDVFNGRLPVAWAPLFFFNLSARDEERRSIES